MNLFNQLKKVVTIDYPENQNNIRIFINRQNQEFLCTVYNVNNVSNFKKMFSDSKYDIKLIEEDNNQSSKNWEIKLKDFNNLNDDEIYDLNVTLNKSRIEIKNIIFNKNNIFSPNEKFIIVFESFGVPIGYNNRLIEYLEDLNQTRMENINNLRNNNNHVG